MSGDGSDDEDMPVIPSAIKLQMRPCRERASRDSRVTAAPALSQSVNVVDFDSHFFVPIQPHDGGGGDYDYDLQGH